MAARNTEQKYEIQQSLLPLIPLYNSYIARVGFWGFLKRFQQVFADTPDTLSNERRKQAQGGGIFI